MDTVYTISDAQRSEILRQIARMTRLSIDGGRPAIPTPTGVELVCGSGYRVRIELDPSDTYTVTRLFRRAGRYYPKGSVSDVYCDELSETAYRAGMFRDEWPAAN